MVDARGGYISPGLRGYPRARRRWRGLSWTERLTRCASPTAAHTRHGTTSIFPTTTTGTPAQLDAMLKACATVQREWSIADGARLQGVHFYGPYFAANKVGAHAPAGPARSRRGGIHDYFSRGIIKVATCAAELPGAEAYFPRGQKGEMPRDLRALELELE